MSSPTTQKSIRYSKADPSRYDFVEGSHISAAYVQRERLVRRLNIADAVISGASGYTAKIVRAALPVILAEKEVKSVEFINYNQWKQSASVIGALQGAVLRGKNDDVLLFVSGISLGGAKPESLGSFILDSLGISGDKQREIYNQTFPHAGSSVVIELL